MHRHALTDAQWARLQPLLPRRPQGRKSTRGDRLFVDAVIFCARTGIQWRDLPERFGNWKSVYNRFRNWARKDVWAQVFRELRIDVDDTASIVDGTTVRAHQDASGGKGGSNRMLWDALEEVFRPRSTPSSTRKRDRSTSRSRPASATS
jgi:transposase